MKSNYKINKNKRYYLHKKVREQGYALNSFTKTIEIESGVEISAYVERLITEFGYNVQLTIS